MKKLFIYIIATIFVTGCNEELNLIPKNTVTEALFWETADDAVFSINGVYNVLAHNNMYRDFFIHSDALSNNAYSPLSYMYFLEISEGTGFDSNSPLPANVWKINYRGIVRANRLLENIGGIEMDDELKNRIIGEAKFLRALFYFHLTNLYGDVPLVLNIQTVPESLVPRNSKASLVTQILADLSDAETILPTSYGITELGRATQGAATALKCRVHLYNKQYAEAISAAEKVSAMGYDLVSTDDFSNIFLPVLENNNVESIFEVQFLGRTGEDGVGSIFNSRSDALPEFESGVFSPVQELVEIYDEKDLRLPATILRPGDIFAGVEYDGSRSETGYCYKKYLIADPTVTSDGDANYVVIRFAEVLLNLAEAENELNGPAGAYKPINRIRKRAGLDDLPTGLTKEQMRDAIKLERRKELAFEGHHYFDLLRYGADDLKAAMEEVTSVPGHTRVFQSRFILWPVPQAQININPNLLPNNEGW